jgi:hypothetical protein
MAVERRWGPAVQFFTDRPVYHEGHENHEVIGKRSLACHHFGGISGRSIFFANFGRSTV